MVVVSTDPRDYMGKLELKKFVSWYNRQERYDWYPKLVFNKEIKAKGKFYGKPGIYI